MGCMWLLGVVLWTGIVLSAVHFSSAGEALSEVNNLACTGSSCGIETVRWRSFTNRAMVTSRKLMLASELSTSDNDDIFLDSDERGDMVFSADYGHKPPPPTRSLHTLSGPDPFRRPSSPPVKKRSLIKTALVTGRGILTIPELSSTDRQVYTDAEHFERDYSETRGPPPPKHSTPGQAPHKPDPRPDPPPTE